MKGSWHRGIEKVPIRVFDGESISEVVDPVIRELSFELNVNGRELAALTCAGLNLEELAAGWLRSEGIVSSRDDIESINIFLEIPRAAVKLKKDIAEKNFPRSTASDGGRGVAKGMPGGLEKGTTADLRISPRQVLLLMRGLMQSARIHDLTRGTYCSALAQGGKIIVSREDIGRLNTIDMLGGYSLLNGIDCADKVLLTTGRVSSEIVMKADRIGVPVIISHSASTSKAITLAGESGITLVGYVRGGRFKIYTGGHRIAARAERKGPN